MEVNTKMKQEKIKDIIYKYRLKLNKWNSFYNYNYFNHRWQEFVKKFIVLIKNNY